MFLFTIFPKSGLSLGALMHSPPETLMRGAQGPPVSVYKDWVKGSRHKGGDVSDSGPLHTPWFQARLKEPPGPVLSRPRGHTGFHTATEKIIARPSSPGDSDCSAQTTPLHPSPAFAYCSSK